MAKQYPYTEEELREYLIAKQEELGRRPTKKDIPDKMKPYYRVYWKKWCYALEACGLKVPSEETVERRNRHKNWHKLKNAAAKEKREELKREKADTTEE